MTPTVQNLLDEIEAYIITHGMTATEFGLTCKGDRAFVFRLREGMDVRASTVDNVRQWMMARPLGPNAPPRRELVAA